ncbi:MAG: hypothetical protein CMB96_06215 [Flavobacteriaceae bacterium]|nr:hypothetical protein [Flavobacteriaceae bacterium]
MKWAILSVISAIAGSLWSLSIKYGLEVFSPISFAGWYSFIASLISIGAAFYKTHSLKISKYGIGAGIASGIAIACAAKAINIGPNPGFCMALIRMQAILTAIMSYFIWGAPLTPLNILGMILACIGVLLLVMSGNVKKHVVKQKEEEKQKQEEKQAKTAQTAAPTSKIAGYEWVIFSLLAALAMTGKDLFTKTALIKYGKSTFMDLFWNTAFFSVIAVFGYMLIKNKSLDLKLTKSEKSAKDYYKDAGYYVGLTALAFSLYQFTVIAASKEAPNVGFVKSIDTLGIILTSIVSYYEFNSALDGENIVGMICIVLGACCVSYGGKLPFMDSRIVQEVDKIIKRMFDGLSWGGSSSNAHGLQTKLNGKVVSK